MLKNKKDRPCDCGSGHKFDVASVFHTEHEPRRQSALRTVQGVVVGDKTTWALVLTDHTRSSFNEEELNQLVWDTWMEVCDELAQ